MVCFNWDNFIERAYLIEFGREVSPPVVYLNDVPTKDAFFWKPHGCVTQPDGDWVLPGQGTQIHPQFQDHYQPFRNRARIVLCLGFSGEGFTVAEIKSLLDAHVLCYDCRPDMPPRIPLGDYFISFSAEFVLSRIVARLSPPAAS